MRWYVDPCRRGAQSLQGCLLAALTRDQDDAYDVFSQACEDIWVGFPRFLWQSTFRTWAYTVTRHAHHRFASSPFRRRRRSLSAAPHLNEITAAVRTKTQSYLRTDVKDRVARLRERLSVEEQTLLILRVDRDLSWPEIAAIMLPPGEDRTPARVAQLTATCRKRFERTTARLRRLAEEEGLIKDSRG